MTVRPPTSKKSGESAGRTVEISREPSIHLHPAIIPGLGKSGGFEMVLEARDDATYADLQNAVDTLRHYAAMSSAISNISTSIQSDIPQLYFNVDRDRAKMQGIPVSDIFSTMKAFTAQYMSTTSTCSTAYTEFTYRPMPHIVLIREISTCSL